MLHRPFKLAKVFQKFAKVANFRQIWSRCLDFRQILSRCLDFRQIWSRCLEERSKSWWQFFALGPGRVRWTLNWTWWTQKIFQRKRYKDGSGCGFVGRAAASNARGPRFESSHQQKKLFNVYCQVYWKDENKEKEAGIGPFKKEGSEREKLLRESVQYRQGALTTRGSITVQLTSCLAGLVLTKQVIPHNSTKAKQLN